MQSSALDSALRLLAVRDHSEAELTRKLAAKKFPDAEISAVLERLRELGYIDERRFARSFAESAIRNGKGYGVKLQHELSRRGVSAAVRNEVLQELGEEYGEKETLADVVSRRFSAFDAEQATEKEMRRVVSYLQRKGFSLRAIFAQLKHRGADFEE